jgi:hypothetical protein
VPDHPSTPPIPDEAVEAAARAAFEATRGPDHEWSRLSPTLRDEFRAGVRPVLAAAAPAILEGRVEAVATVIAFRGRGSGRVEERHRRDAREALGLSSTPDGSEAPDGG